MKKRFIFSIFAFASFILGAQDTIHIQDVEILANRVNVKFMQAAQSVTVLTREDIASTSVSSVNELLEFVADLDVKQRGVNGVQADIGIRGSNFAQVLIMLNGIKMNDPQSGHLSMNLPVELIDIERIEILKGGASRKYGPGAFAGAINIITKNKDSSSIKVILEAGEYGWTQQGVSGTVALKNQTHSLSILKKSSDGYIRNTDFEMENLFFQSDFKLKKGAFFFNFGRNSKDFGAQNFYSANFPEQFEENRVNFASVGGLYEYKNLKFEPQAYYRKSLDHFELFREDFDYYRRIPNSGAFTNNLGDTIPWYTEHNNHESTTRGAGLNVSLKSGLGITSIGYNYRYEGVISNQLGETLEEPIKVKNQAPSAFYLKGVARENHSMFFEHNVVTERFFVSFGFLYNLNSDFNNKWCPGFDLSFQLSENWRPYGSINKSFRLPTYTDLYYSLGGAVGSKDLEAEESINYELGVKYNLKKAFGHLAFFQRQGKNLIDWVRLNGSPLTQATNLTQVTISGVEADARIKANHLFNNKSPIESIKINYAYLYSDTTSTNFESNYVLDFLAHKANFDMQLKLMDNLFLTWMISYQNRKGSYINAQGDEKSYPEVFLSDLRISPHFGKLKIFVQVSNLFNQQYTDIGSVQQIGRWVKAGISYDFSCSEKE